MIQMIAPMKTKEENSKLPGRARKTLISILLTAVLMATGACASSKETYRDANMDMGAV